jgi:gamma-glutamyltranspeptidase/glutathione hydrolase
VLIVVAPACGPSPSEVGAQSPFSPGHWPAVELERALQLQTVSQRDAPTALAGTATTNIAMVAATADPLAVHAGIEALKSGGTAADAAVTTALAQIALDVGGGTSYAGLMTALYYEAESSQVHSLNAAYTIPSTFNRPGESVERRLAVMVPGFFAGAEELHRRFGRLSWSSLFGPAIWVADHGVPVGPVLFVGVQEAQAAIQRSPTAARVLLKPNRQPYAFGELFRQPDLAATLSEIAVLGTDYVYSGRWARHFSEMARASGADINADDLRSYRAAWMPPLRVQHGEFEVLALPPPNAGGGDILSALKLVEASHVAAAPPASASADTLFSLV